jgi:hypothetical protein
MKQAIQRLNLQFVIALVVVMLICSSQAVHANLTTNHTNLPDFIIRFAEYESKGNTTKLNILLNQWEAQEQIKENRIASTNGAVLHFDPQYSLLSSAKKSLLTTSYSWLASISGSSEPMYDTEGNLVARIQYPDSLKGAPDGNDAILMTVGWNKNYNNPLGGEAMAWGPMLNYHAIGDVYIYAHTSPDYPGFDNDVIIEYSSDGSTWIPLGYASVSNTSPRWVYMGHVSTVFSYISVICWTPAPYPHYYYPLIHNYVWIDSVWTYGW